MGLCDTPAIVYLGDKLLYHIACEMRTLPEDATVAEKIRFYRMKRDMNGDMLAELIGMSRFAIMYYESGEREPLLHDLKNMAAVLGIEADKLYDDYYRFLDYPCSAKIKEIRAAHNLTQNRLGKILVVDRRTVERWENGKTSVSRNTWDKLKGLGFI